MANKEEKKGTWLVRTVFQRDRDSENPTEWFVDDNDKVEQIYLTLMFGGLGHGAMFAERIPREIFCAFFDIPEEMSFDYMTPNAITFANENFWDFEWNFSRDFDVENHLRKI